MFCKNCGRQIPDNAAFCPSCGTRRSGGDSFGEAKSGRDIKNLPDYAKENDLNRSSDAIDTNRKNFRLSDSGQKKFSLSDSDQKKFSLSGSGQKKFTLSGRDNKDAGDGIVRISANREPAGPPKNPTGFVNPLKDSGKTVFHDSPAGYTPPPAGYTPPPGPAAPAPEMRPYAPRPSAAQPGEPASGRAAQTAQTVFDNGGNEANRQTGGQTGGQTGFVNPLKTSGQEIHWGSDGDRNEANNAGFADNPEEIDTHMGFSVFTLLCCCQPTSILAIIFSAMVSHEVKKGNYEQARKYSSIARILCWISIILSLFCGGVSSIVEPDRWSVDLPASSSSSVEKDEEESESGDVYESEIPAPNMPADTPANNR